MDTDDSKLEMSILVLLNETITEHWTDVDADNMTGVDEQAIKLLVAAGLVERRISMEIQFVGSDETFELRFRVTGEQGLQQALEQAGPHLKAYSLDDAEQPLCTLAGGQQWRLTSCGIEARDEDSQSVAGQTYLLDFVMKRVNERTILTSVLQGTPLPRVIVGGWGIVEKLEKKPAPREVEVTNFRDLATMLEEIGFVAPEEDGPASPERWRFKGALHVMPAAPWWLCDYLLKCENQATRYGLDFCDTFFPDGEPFDLQALQNAGKKANSFFKKLDSDNPPFSVSVTQDRATISKNN